jgi:tetratricopeptide (TPR) repeat protein
MRLLRVVPGNAALAITIWLIAAATPLQGGTNEERLTGLSLFSAGRFQEAIPFFDQVLARHSRDIEILIKRGACYLRLDQPEKAIADFDRVNQYSRWSSRVFGPVLSMLPDTTAPDGTWRPLPLTEFHFAENWGNRGTALLMLGRDDEALESFRVSTVLWSSRLNDPRAFLPADRPKIVRSHAAAYEGLGQAYHRLRQDELAFQAYTHAISIDPTDPNGFAGRGDVLHELKFLDAAQADYDEAIRLDANHSRAHCGRGIMLTELGRDDLALADLDRAIALDPKFAKAYSHRGALHARRGENKPAVDDYDALIRLAPANAGAYKDRGGILVRIGLFARAIDDLNEAIRLDPKRATAWQNRGAAYNGLGQYERAIDDLTHAIELDPDNAGAFSNRGLAYFAVGQYDQSIADLSEAVRLAPRNAIAFFNRAEVFARLELRDRALSDYDQATRLDSRLVAAHAASARLRQELGQRAQAIHELDMALQLDPKGISLYQDRGNVRREEGDWRGALADYDRAIMLDPERGLAYVARGWSRLSAGVEGADFDARIYLKLKGWHDGLAPYMAVLAVLGARQAGRAADGQQVLDEALVNLAPRVWPMPILRYLHGDLNEDALFHAALSDRQQAEAHAFVGLDQCRAGDQQAGLAHLRNARDHGAAGSIAVDVARATLARIEGGAK